MARILGVNIPDDKRVEYALTLIYGVGFPTASKVIKEAGIKSSRRVNELNEGERKRLQDILEKKYTVEGDLKEVIHNNIKRLKEIGSYRGLRHSMGLPSRGQRTRSNARTKRGKRRTVGAYKKEDLTRIQQS